MAFLLIFNILYDIGISLVSSEKCDYRLLTTDYILSGTLIPSKPIAEAITLAVISDN